VDFLLSFSGVISGAMLFIETEFGIESDLLLKEFIVSAAIAGAIFGSIGAAFANEKFGRRSV